MGRALTKAPGQNLAEGVRSGDVVKVRPGVYPPFQVGGLRDVRWEWAEPGQFWVVDGKHSAEFAVRVHDGCSALTFVGMNPKNAGHGIRITKSPGCRFHHYKAGPCGAEGFQAGFCDDLLLEDAEIDGVGKGYPGYPQDRGHCIYLSQAFRKAVIRRAKLSRAGGCAIQLNGRRIEDVLVEDVEAYECGTHGTPAFNLFGVQNSTYRNVLAANNNAGFAMRRDSGSEPCRGVTWERCTFYQPGAKYGTQSLDGSTGNVIRDSILVTGGRVFEGEGLMFANVYQNADAVPSVAAGDYRSRHPGVGWHPAQEPPPPPPPPDSDTTEAELRERVAALEAERDALRDALAEIEALALGARLGG